MTAPTILRKRDAGAARKAALHVVDSPTMQRYGKHFSTEMAS